MAGQARIVLICAVHGMSEDTFATFGTMTTPGTGRLAAHSKGRAAGYLFGVVAIRRVNVAWMPVNQPVSTFRRAHW